MVLVLIAGHPLKLKLKPKYATRGIIIHSKVISNSFYQGAPSINIDSTTKKILLRSRQATCQPSPEATPTPSRETSVEREKVKSVEGEGFIEQEVFLQEKVDPEKYLKFGAEVWR